MRIRIGRPQARLISFWIIGIAGTFCGLTASAIGAEDPRPAAQKPLRVIVFGAHPDDCELSAGGTAARWVKLGYKVKFVSVTNGDIGHYQMAGAILARRRTAEVKRFAEILGIETEVLDNHDGELLPTLDNRRTITRKIREWQADVVISPRPNDYHPDHRYTAILVQDAAFMVIVPSFCPDVPAVQEPGLPLFVRQLPQAQPVPTRRRRADRLGDGSEGGLHRRAGVTVLRMEPVAFRLS